MKKIFSVIISVLLSLTACLSCVTLTGCVNRVEVHFETGTEEAFKPVRRTVGGDYGKLPEPKRKDYAFLGWYTEKMYGEEASESLEVTKTWSHTLYAKWEYLGEEEKITFPLGVQEKRLDASSGSSYYIDEQGNLFAWGQNLNGKLGDGTTDSYPVSIQIMERTKFKYIDQTSYCTYAIDEDGSLWGWGYNGCFELAREGGERYYYSPILIMPERKFYKVTGESGITGHVALAIDQSGNLWAWGDDYKGQLGQGKRVEDSATPLQVMKGTRFIDADTSGNHCAAISEDGRLWLWGENYSGELGNGTSYKLTHSLSDGYSATPSVVVEGVRFSKVFLGYKATYAIDEAGNIWSCGDNGYGKLGNGTQEDCLYLTQITEGLHFSYIESSRVRILALDEYGDLWMLGVDPDKLWDEYFDEDVACLPTELKLNFKVSFVSQRERALVITREGALLGWGNNKYGGIGDGTTEYRHRDDPVRIF